MTKQIREEIDVTAVLASVDIVELISGHVLLKKKGKDFAGLCPFHDEKTPSFFVNKDKQFYYCFGCGRHGDAIQFVRDRLGLDFQAACEHLAGGRTVKIDAAAQAEAKQRQEQAARVLQQEEARIYREVAERAKELWDKARPADTSHPYLARKGIKGFGLRRLRDSLIAAVRDTQSNLLSLQFIGADGNKKFLTGGRTKGGYAAAGRFKNTILICEGIATRDSLIDATGYACAAAFYANNLLPVAQAIRAKHPNVLIVLCADNDQHKPSGNTGVEKAREAAEAVGGVLAIPQFEDLIGEPTDFNDLALRQGKEAVKSCVAAAIAHGPAKAIEGFADIQEEIQKRREFEKLIEACDSDDELMYIIFPKIDGSDLRQTSKAQLMKIIAPKLGISQKALKEGTGDLASKCRQAPRHKWPWMSLIINDGNGTKDCRENVYLYLKHHPELQDIVWADEFARKIVMRRPAPWVNDAGFEEREWEDNDDMQLGLWLAQHDHLVIQSVSTLSHAVMMTAHDRRYHPAQDWLNGLQWDGVSRLNDWLTDYLGVFKNDYAMLAGRMFLIGVVARMMQPGCMVRTMPIFEGAQYRGKSSALRILGGKWFADSFLDLNSKDWYQQIQGCMIYEIAELDAFSRHEASRIKSVISSLSDRFRAPYDHKPKDYPRQVVFAGTVNGQEYFRDKSGNTRFWPIAVEEIDSINLYGLEEARDQLFAEAMDCYRRGEGWHPSAEQQAEHFEPEQRLREIENPIEGAIIRYLRSISKTDVTMLEIFTEGLKIEPARFDPRGGQAMSVGHIMAALKWRKERRRINGDRDYYYIRPKNWSWEGNQP